MYVNAELLRLVYCKVRTACGGQHATVAHANDLLPSVSMPAPSLRKLLFGLLSSCLALHCSALIPLQSVPALSAPRGSASLALSFHRKELSCVRARAPIRLRGGAAGATSSATTDLILKHVAPICGIAVAVSMFYAPLKAVLKARKENSLGELNPLPYPAQVGNCGAWLTYAICVNNPYVMAPNIIGLALGLFFTYTGLSLAKAEVKTTILRNFVLYVSVVLGAIGVDKMKLTTIASNNLYGWVGNVLLMIYYVAPLATIKTVVMTRNADSIDPRLAVAGVLNGLFWFVYGVAIWDGYVAIPNAIGAMLATITTTCYFTFRKDM